MATRRTRGTIAFDGRDLTIVPGHRRAHAGLGWVPQERDIFASLSVEENLSVVARPGPWRLDKVYATFPRLAERRANMAGRGGALNGRRGPNGNDDPEAGTHRQAPRRTIAALSLDVRAAPAGCRTPGEGRELCERAACKANERQALEQLCRYVTRPALANERVQCNAAGQVVLKLKTPWPGCRRRAASPPGSARPPTRPVRRRRAAPRLRTCR